MPSSYNLPELVKKEIDALVKSGYYSSKSDVVKDALRQMFENKKNLRLAAAVGLYKQGEISLGKAAEVANIGIIEFKEMLASRGHLRVLKTSRKEIKRAEESLAKLR